MADPKGTGPMNRLFLLLLMGAKKKKKDKKNTDQNRENLMNREA